MVYQPETPHQMTADQQHAAAVLEHVLQGAIFNHGDAAHSKFLGATKVDITTEYQQNGATNANLQGEKLDFIISNAHAESATKATGQFVVEQLAKIPGLQDKIHFKSDKDEQKELVNSLDKLIASGAPIPKEFKEWPGFKQGDYQVDAHALKVQRSDGDVGFEIRVPKAAALTPAQISEDIQKRLPQIKEVLAERLSKYTVGNTQANKAGILAQLNQMEFGVSINEREYWSEVSVTMRSPQQVAAIKQPGGVNATPDKTALRNTNILMKVSDTDANPQLQKALARAVFTAGNPPPAMLASVLGRKDMAQYFTKTLGDFKKAHPETVKDVDTLIASDAFKDNEWRANKEQEPDKKGSFAISKSEKDSGRLHVTLELPPGYTVANALSDIKALNPSLAAQPAAPHQPAPVFAQVDKVELVGASSPQAFQYAQQVLQQQQKAQPTPQQSQAVANSLTGHAERVLGLVEQAHNEILQAVNEAARQFQQQQKQAPGTLISANQVQPGMPGHVIHP